MRKLGKMLLFLALAGCSSSGDWFHHEEPKPEPLTKQVIPQVAPNKNNLSPAASAAAPTDANESKGELMECVTESCKMQLLSKSSSTIQTKMCARFKEPI
jgi:hypothetical protein